MGKKALQQMAKESWEKMNRSEDMFGFDASETNIIRAEWSALDIAYQLVYKERIDYYDILTLPVSNGVAVPESKLELERLSRDTWMNAVMAEEVLGVHSPEAKIFRAQWHAYDAAFRIVYNERIEYLIQP